MDFVFFLGRMHVLFLHIPIGVILAALVAELLVRRPKYAGLERVLALLWAVAAISAVLSVATGLMHVGEGGFDEATAGSHRFFGILTAVGATVVWILCWKASGIASIRTAVAIVTFLLMLVTTFYGSRLTHGDRFLALAPPAVGSPVPAAVPAPGFAHRVPGFARRPGAGGQRRPGIAGANGVVMSVVGGVSA